MAATVSIAGFGGSVTLGSALVEVNQWKLSLTTDKLDATNMGSAQYKEYIAGLSGAEGSLTCQGTADPPALSTSTLVAISLKTKSTGGATIAGSGLVKSVSINTPVDGKVSYDVSFVFSGSVGIS